MSDPKAPKLDRSSSQVANTFSSLLPQIMQSIGRGIGPLENAELRSAQATSEPYAALQAQLYRQFGPQQQETANNVNRIAQEGQAATDLGVVSGTGRDLTSAAVDNAKIADPEYYGLRPLIADKTKELLSGNLTGGEESAIERNLNQQNSQRGLLNAPTATGTVAGAMQYGNAARQRMLEGLGAANATLPGLKSGMDTFKVATGRDSASLGLADSKFAGVHEPGTEGVDTGNQFLSNIFGLKSQQNQINSDRRDALDRVSQFQSSLPSVS